MNHRNRAGRWCRTHYFGLLLGLIAVVALAVRLAFVWRMHHLSIAAADQQWYYHDGRQVAAGKRLYFSPSPLYVYFLGAIGKLGLPLASFKLVVGAIQSLWLGSVVVMAGLLGRKYLAPWAGLLAAVVLALEPNSVAASAGIMTESLVVWLLMVALFSLFYPERRQYRYTLVAGLALGLAVLTRAAVAPVVPIAAVYVVCREGRLSARSLLRLSAQLLATGLVVIAGLSMPIALLNIPQRPFLLGSFGVLAILYVGLEYRNVATAGHLVRQWLVASRRFTQLLCLCGTAATVVALWIGGVWYMTNIVSFNLNAQGPLNICLSNRDGSTGMWNTGLARKCEAETQHLGSKQQIDAAMTRHALQWARTHPGDELRLMGTRARITMSSNIDAAWLYGNDMPHATAFDHFEDWWWPKLMVLAAAGALLWLVDRQHRWLGWLYAWSAAQLVAPMLVVGDPRYHAPFLAIIVLGAVASVQAGAQLVQIVGVWVWRQRHPRQLPATGFDTRHHA